VKIFARKLKPTIQLQILYYIYDLSPLKVLSHLRESQL